MNFILINYWLYKNLRLFLIIICFFIHLNFAKADVHPIVRIIVPERVIDVVTEDFNRDGEFDRAILVESDDVSEANLLLYLSSSNQQMKFSLDKRNIAFRGVLWGMLPNLTSDSFGKLVVESKNASLGRNRWNLKLMILYRENEFQVVGVNYEWYDTLDINNRGACKIDLLAQHGIKKEKKYVTNFRAIALTAWEEEITNNIIL